MALPYSTRSSWVVKTITTTKTSTADLKPFELGIFDYSGCKAAGGFQASPYIFFAVGSPNQPSKVSSSPKVRSLLDRNQAVSYKTDKMYGKELLPARVSKPSKTSTPMVTYIGYDGINDCSNLDFKYGRTYTFTIRLYNSAATAMFGGGRRLQDTVTVTVPSRDECDASCTEPQLGYLVIDELVNKLNNTWVSPAVRAEKLMSCCNTVALTKFYCREWTLTQCDEGNELSLASIQAQYSTQKIYIKSRVGTMTTYAFVQDDAVAAPASYTTTDVKIVNCTTCPSGYTTTAASKIIIVEMDDDGLATSNSAALTRVQTVIPTATKAIKTGFAFGTSTYVVSVPTTWVMPAPIADVKITDTGSLSPIVCTQTTPITTAWVSGLQTYRVKRTLQITVDNPDCSGTELPAIVAAYTVASDVVSGSIILGTAGSCKSIFTLDQYSNCMEDGCDTLAIAQFKELPSYKGHTWEINPCAGWTVSVGGCPIPPATAAIRDCRVGVKLIGGLLDLSTQSCIFDPDNGVNYDPIYFEVAVSELMSVGEPGGMRPTDTPITTNRQMTRAYLSGQEVIREIITYRCYKQNEMYMNPDAFAGAYRFSTQEGQKFGVDLNKFYYAVYINHDKLGRQWNQHMDMATKTELALYFAEDDYPAMVQFLAAYNSYSMSAGVSMPAIVI